ncbi:MAG: ABC transporter ATP-binding protein [Acidimicrobiaceae bacterium]|nr:ABC transporter ATP-binding protein [Acidimicrobiaceae bacterium]
MADPAGFLEVRGLTVRFGGVVAVRDVDLDVREGELLGIIGPNGAGKTTLFNVIAGAIRPTKGIVSLGGERLSGKRPAERARAGVGRTFQTVRLFKTMTVEENVRLAAAVNTRSGAEARRRVDHTLGLLDLDFCRDRVPGELTLAEQKRVEIARALSMGPRLLLLDEMMNGLTAEETDNLMEIVSGLHRGGLTVVLIEHVLRVVTSLCSRVFVLNYGRAIADGAPEEVMRMDAVREAYLGGSLGRHPGPRS